MTNATDVAESAAPAQPASTEAPALSTGYVRYALWLLLFIYIFNFIDRQVVNILSEDIKRDLHLNDTQYGMLAGLAFAVLYSLLGIPIARLAESRSRPGIMSVSLTIWSFFTVLCGQATSFGQLFLFRIGVGIGEAGGSPPAHALIADYVPREKRASALAFYSMGVPIGTLLGMVLGGFIADRWGWRAAFWVAGAPGIPLAIVTILTLKETRKKLTADMRALHAKNHPNFWAVLAKLANKKTFICISLAAALKSFLTYAQSAYHTGFFLRNHLPEVHSMAQALHMGDRSFVGTAIGLLTGIGGAFSSIVGGYVCDWAVKKDVRNAMLAPAYAFIISVPFYVAAMLVSSAQMSLILLIVPYFGNYFWYGPVYSLTQGLVPPNMRSTAAAVLLFVINMIGLAGGPPLAGLASDILANMQLAPHGLSVDICKAAGKAASDLCLPATGYGVRWSMIITGLIGIPAGLLLFLARKWVREEMES